MNNMAADFLLIEDNPHDAEMTIRALRKKKLANNIIHLSDGKTALDFLFAMGDYGDRNVNPRPKVILLDLKLPKVDGLEILRKIKADDGLKSIPVVVLTSSKEGPDIEQSYALGANSYIVKPVEFDNFIKAISELGLYWLVLNEPPA